MRSNPISLLTILLFFSISTFAQQETKFEIRLKGGTFIPHQNISQDSIKVFNEALRESGGMAFVILQFENIPSTVVRQEMQKAGIDLVDYVSGNGYTAIISSQLDPNRLIKWKVRAIASLSPGQKMEPVLARGQLPLWAIKVPGTVDVWISFPQKFSVDMVVAELQSMGFPVLSTEYSRYRVLVLRVSPARLHELAAAPFVEFVQAAPREAQPINDKSISNGRGNLLKSALPGERNLQGRGVVVGVGDNANPMQHVDFNNRVINRMSLPNGAHGIHVMGTLSGAGNVEERYAGFAPRATILKQNTAKVWVYAPTYVQDHGMVITNNSYGIVVDDCTTFGVYDLWSRMLDMQSQELPSLQNVFSVGNSGAMSCSPYPSGFGTVLGSYQTSKNVLCVGATDEFGAIAGLSSRGPVRDGRIKPEITTQGLVVWSTWPTNNYIPNNGTSMASPAASGGLALLYERYRQLNGNINPENGLMKALLVNGAIDRGNAGPDYTYGFGWMNLLRSVKMLEQSNYFHDSVANGITNHHNITVPANTAQLKVLLYWNDPAASALASQALVNDLDLEVRDGSSTLTLPMLLDTSAANVGNAAGTGADHFNNIEQVVIDNPPAGSYNLRVIGTGVNVNPQQEYFLVYDTIPVSTTLTYPVGGEHFNTSDSIYISWDAFGNPGNDFTLQYSTDNSTWTNIATNLSAITRQYEWRLPDTTTDQARVRLIHNGTGIQQTSEPFTIIGVPLVSVAPMTNQCEGYFTINWTSVPNATDYEVMLLRGEEMVSVGTSTGNSFSIGGLSKDTTYFASVRARISGNPGRRGRAVSRLPVGGSCPGTMSDFDLKMDAILAPASGRELTSSALGASTVVSARIKNLDNAVVANFNMKYSVNGGAFVSEPATNIAAQANYTHNFATTYDFSALGDYQLTVVVENTSGTDPVPANDTLRILIRHLPNAPITLSIGNDYLDDFESLPDSSYTRGKVGLAGADRYDFNSSTSFGRLRTFVNSGIANSGERALTLDSERYNSGGTADSLKGTFNLLPHAGTLDDVRFDFTFKNHGQSNHAANKVWIRGSDTDPWIEVYDLYANQADPGVVKQSPSFELADLLAAASQDFSTSFQVRFGQFGQFITADNETGSGYTFDDLHLYVVENDLQVVSIDTPVVSSCGLNASVPIRITVRNNADTTIVNIPVKYSADGGATVSETIATIAGNTNDEYIFTATADLSATGTHTIVAWVDYADDSYRSNDTVRVTIVNSPVFASFPYLENFESGDGGWYSGGVNNSWAFGTPSSPKIDRAASGTNAWKTNLSGSHNGDELSYLYSPCYDLSGLARPQLSFSLALDIEDCGDADPQDDDNELCDGAYVEYSTDGINWSRLGAKGEGTNWYNKAFTNNHLWAVHDYTRWHVATISLPQGISNLRLRFVLASDPFLNREGIAIDDIHIYDSVFSIYDGPPYTSNSVNQSTVNGSGWIDFTDGGELIASINPDGQNLGSTDARAYINTGGVRISSAQFYHDRNITLKPTNVSLADSATVRFYFLDTEMETLINATGCPGCSKPSSAYELGVSKYSDADDSREDGTTFNNLAGGWLYIPPSQTTIVPFGKGYYAEFRVKDFSEFWLNNGGINSNQTLPVELVSFTARKAAQGTVLAEWVTVSEENVLNYEVELARGNGAFQQNDFEKIGEMPANNLPGEQRYSFADMESNKTGVRYYRLRIVDLDGRYTYSPVRPVVFGDEVKWQLYPNPSRDIFNLILQENVGEPLSVKVIDANGRVVYRTSVKGTGFIQKISISLRDHAPAGIYLVEVETGTRREVFRGVLVD